METNEVKILIATPEGDVIELERVEDFLGVDGLQEKLMEELKMSDEE